MAILTKDLQDKFNRAALLAENLSESEKIVFYHEINATALQFEKHPKNIAALKAMLKQSEQKLANSKEAQETLASLITHIQCTI